MDPNKPKQSPPAEHAATVSSRRWIILSFWLVVACLGLPHWLWTTSIPRANLPLEAMNEWAEGRACGLEYPLNIHLQSETLGGEQLNEVATLADNQLKASSNLGLLGFHVAATDQSTQFSPSGTHDGHVAPSLDADIQPALTVHLRPNPSPRTQAGAAVLTPTLDIDYDAEQAVSVDALAMPVVQGIQRTFQDEYYSLSHLLLDTPFATKNQLVLEPDMRQRLDARTTRAFKYAPSYHLTFSLFTASASPSAWAVEAALKQYVTPLLEALSGISNFTVETQVQLHASISPSISGPHYDANTKEWRLERSDLSGFVNAAEWPLNPSIGLGPTINFVLYVPSTEQSPLVIADTGENSWLIPQWGGVQILNPPGKEVDSLTVQQLEPVMLVFADQLTKLLGLPPGASSLALRISSLTRERATSLIISASSTLGALANLTLKLKSIAIPDSVAKSVDETIHRLDMACRDLREGRYGSALQNARIAEAEAEQAFFEPSMVGQVYFPDEHKVAVYVPLLGPMAVPLVMTGVKELRKLRAAKQKLA